MNVPRTPFKPEVVAGTDLATSDPLASKDEDEARIETGGQAPPPPPPADRSEAKLLAKKYNESIKLIASAFNGLGMGVLSVGYLQPLLKDPVLFSAGYRPTWYIVGLCLHVAGHFIIRINLVKED